MTTNDKKLLSLCLSGFKDKNIDEKDHKAFTKDYAMFAKGELTFRELIATIKSPRGTLREALQSYYNKSAYTRVFKGR